MPRQRNTIHSNLYKKLEEEHRVEIEFKELTIHDTGHRMYFREANNTRQAVYRWAKENGRRLTIRYLKDEGKLIVEVLD